MYPVDTSGDWAIVEGIEAVTFYPLQGEGQYGAGVLTKGKLMPLSKKEIEMGDAQLIIHGAVWHLWKALLPVGVIPKYGDKIVQNATNLAFYINPSMEVVSLSNRYRCVTQKQVGGNQGVT